MALSLFGYMRSAEIQKLDWQDIDFARRTITVSASISKTNRKRLIEINDTLLHWLTPNRQESGAIVDHLNGEVSKLFLAANVGRLHNGLRHSCCSFASAHYGETVGLTKICQQAGHSESIASRHY